MCRQAMHSIAVTLLLLGMSCAAEPTTKLLLTDSGASRRSLQAKSCICPLFVKPVCGVNGKTYSNSCLAKCAGVGVASQGECPCICPAIYAPVCGKDGNTYSSGCAAKCKGVAVASDGECPCLCTKVYRPVCASGDSGATHTTYGNACEAKCAKAAVVHQGACKVATKGRKLQVAKPCNCPAVYKPVCAQLPGGVRRTFGNSCLAGCAKAAVVGNEPCSGGAAVQSGAAGGEGDACGGLAGVACKGGLICDAPATPDAQGVCTKPPPADGMLGGKCGGFIGIPCDVGLTCITPPSTADAFGVCQVVSDPQTPVVGEGQSCGGFRAGPIPVCDRGLSCKTNPRIADAPGVCAPIPVAGLGESCGGYPPPGSFPPLCGAGLVCKTDPKVPDAPGICMKAA